jgi:hypothetical protein
VTTGSVYIKHKTLLSRTPEAIAMTAISIANGEKPVLVEFHFLSEGRKMLFSIDTYRPCLQTFLMKPK